MTHASLTEPSLSPHPRKGREQGTGNGTGNVGPKAPSIVTEATRETATMDGRSAADHVHRFVPKPDGRLYGKVRYRNRCADPACDVREHPEPPRPLVRGPLCWACGAPTVAGTVDPVDPRHPCCAEPLIMSIGLAAARRRRKTRR